MERTSVTLRHPFPVHSTHSKFRDIRLRVSLTEIPAKNERADDEFSDTIVEDLCSRGIDIPS